MRIRNSLRIGIPLAIGSLVVITASLSAATIQEKPTYRATGSEGTILGTISFAGRPPKPLQIDTSADPVLRIDKSESHDRLGDGCES